MTTVTGILRAGDGSPVGTRIRWQMESAPGLESDGDVVGRSVVVCDTDPTTGAWSVSLEAGDWIATWVIASIVSTVRVRVPGSGAMTMQEAATAWDDRLKVQLLAWAAAESFTLTDWSTLLTSSPVIWPDGRTGTFTCVTPNEEWAVPDAYTVTYQRGGQTLTVRQPAVTRDALGVITHRPALQIT